MNEDRASSPRRVLALRAVLLLLALANAYGLWLGLTHRAELVGRYPGLVPWWPVYLACPVVSLVSLAAIAMRRRWGFWLALAVGLVVLAIEGSVAESKLHLVRVPVAMLVLTLAVRANWRDLR